MDCIQINPEMYVTKDDLYACFAEYCAKKGLPLIAKNTFSMRLHEHVRVRDYKATISDERVYCWAGIGFSEMSRLSGMSKYLHYFITQAHTDSNIKIRKNMDVLDYTDIKEEGDGS